MKLHIFFGGVAVALAASGAAIVGCSSDDGGGSSTSSSGASGGSSGSSGSSGGGLSQASVDAYAGAICDKLQQCAPFFVTGQYGDVATCKTRVALGFKDELLLPDTTINDTNGKACIDAYAAASCETVFSGAGVPACDFKGTRANGAACGSDTQCQSGSCYKALEGDGGSATRATCGTCKAPVAENGDCSAAECERGLSCIANKCVRPVKENGDCIPAEKPCESTLNCVSGKCVKPLALGAACENGANKNRCDGFQGAFCKPTVGNPSAGTCAKFTFAAVGAQCGLDTATFEYTQCTGSSCVTAAGSSKGTCTAYLKDGDACDLTSGKASCQNPASCKSGKCTISDAASCK